MSQDEQNVFGRLNAVSMADSGSSVLAGCTSGGRDGENGLGGDDFAVVKLDANGNELWRWQVRP